MTCDQIVLNSTTGFKVIVPEIFLREFPSFVHESSKYSVQTLKALEYFIKNKTWKNSNMIEGAISDDPRIVNTSNVAEIFGLPFEGYEEEVEEYNYEDDYDASEVEALLKDENGDEDDFTPYDPQDDILANEFDYDDSYFDHSDYSPHPWE